jgi:hypothetical protein
VLSNRFTLVRATGPGGLRATQADGWHGLESAAGSGERWEWTGREAVLVVENPRGRPVRATLKLDARAHGARQFELVDAAGERIGAAVSLGETRTRVDLGPITLPSGTSRWMLRSVEPALRASPADPRMIALCVHRLRVEAGGN